MKKVDVVDLNNKQYRKLIKVQRDAYKKILNYCISNIKDIEKAKSIEKYIEAMDKAISNELENIRIDNEKYIDM
ncbi:hypothetical protein FDB55_11865 [Clostridium botulinum]|uniref:Uncharacterized protein n=1 Tax=Clostridium botulinum TaxID=1491 RepID=A0A0C2SGE3_CLOBO|nr:hypothetical protein [Clostridium botulinum]EES48605.1 hypothetical protein CLO_1716 [Clostridium botulinum E1 str. 'BoNT E Beluga']KAI3349765.1 hypothetical protein CIT18_06580 [Clostridium botulinum]KIL07108.1 hypothetical protein SR42_13010 [Clostridium botulinum]KOM89482.1 hypothetical protein ACP51_01950 [Clostridium botulinum]KOR61151.1 hypothetical protein ADT22_07660 [Clostridium botulinum]